MYIGSYFSVDAGNSNFCYLIVLGSTDGINYWRIEWDLPSGTQIRDPSIYFDGTTYWLVGTSASSTTSFPVFKSTIIGGSWTHVTDVDCSGVTNFATWAPEWFIDDDNSVHVIVAISSGAIPFQEQFTPYEVHPTLSDMSTWSGLTSINLVTTSIPTSCFDYYLVSPNNSPLGKYTLWYHDQNGGSRIQYATSTTLTGTYTFQTTGNWLGIEASPEGPQAIKIGGTWYLFYDNSGGNLYTGFVKYVTLNSLWTSASASADINVPPSVPSVLKQGTLLNIADGPLFSDFFDTITLSDTSEVLSIGVYQFNDSISLSDSSGVSLLAAIGFPVDNNAILGTKRLGAARLGFPKSTGFTGSFEFSDTITLSDAVTTSWNYALSISDSITLSDDISYLGPLQFGFDDTISLSDVISVDLTTPTGENISVSDTLTFSDNVVIGTTNLLTQAVGDSLTLSDAIASSGATLTLGVSDTLTFVDFGSSVLVVADSFTIGDVSMNLEMDGFIPVSDVLTPIDSQQITLTDSTGVQILLTLADDFAFSDTIVNSFTVALTVSDSMTVSDNSTPLGSDVIVETDTITFSDAMLVYSSTPGIPLSDRMVFVDRITLFSQLLLNPFDDIFSISDNLTVQLLPINLTAGVSDAIALSDNVVYRYDSIAAAFSDTVTLVDNVSIMNYNIESFAVTDAIQFSDSVCVTEIPSLNSYLRRYLNDAY